MKEQLIGYGTAKLAKEKGFNWLDNSDYIWAVKDGVPELVLNDMRTIIYDHLIITTTQSLLQKWLREEHNIEIDISARYNERIDLEYSVSVFDSYETALDKVMDQIEGRRQHYNTYEEALEEGLQEALELIK